MKKRSFFKKNIVPQLLCLMLCAAVVLSMALPSMELEHAMPEAPQGDVQEIAVLQMGETADQISTIMVPSGGSTPPTEPVESDSQEQDPDETKPQETLPEETQTDEQDTGDGEEGNEDGNQGEEGGDLAELDLAVVMTWYKYGNTPQTIVCGPSEVVSKSINTAQLVDNRLKYGFSITGTDIRGAEITSVSMAEGDGSYKRVSGDGAVDIRLGEGMEERRYTFQVTAKVSLRGKDGRSYDQEVTFLFVLRCSYSLDLELNLRWKKADGSQRSFLCRADGTETVPVRRYELEERLFIYSVTLSGALAEDARITDVRYTTESGGTSGKLEPGNSSVILNPAPGKDSEVYQITFAVETPQRSVLFTYRISYQEVLDVKLSFRWMEGGRLERLMTCLPGSSVSERVRTNQLSAGTVSYSMELTGTDAAEGKIMGVSYSSEAASAGILEEEGSLPMSLPASSTSNTYRISVNALVKGQRLTFEVVFYYSNDVMLQMDYEVLEEGVSVQRTVTCENGRSRTAESIYDSQLEEGSLSYSMRIVGSDGEDVSITEVSCYQSGTGRTLTLSDTDTITLHLKDGKTGENTFAVHAKDAGGNEYSFTVNIPYKHKGENSVRIETNLKDGQIVINDTVTNLSVKAWSEDAAGNVTDYIPANGTDTTLRITFDGEVLGYVSTSGVSSEYHLNPANPEEGDTNTHILNIYAEDPYGNFGEVTLTLQGQRRDPGQKIGEADIYVDLTVVGVGLIGPLRYDVLADEPVSYVIAKAIMGMDTGAPFGKARETYGWQGYFEGTLDNGFYLAGLTTGFDADSLTGAAWADGRTAYDPDGEETVLRAIDERFGAGTGLATLWRCIYRNGLNKSSAPSGGAFNEFDYTSDSGWMYSVDGETYYPGQSMSATYLRDGSVLTVRYTLAQGWDVSGGSPGYGVTIGYCVSALNGHFSIQHQLEETRLKDGSWAKVCRCCGIIQNCDHSFIWQDMGFGSHMQYCTLCETYSGDKYDHTWDEEEAGETDFHICADCGSQEHHSWKIIEVTATCDGPGEMTRQCRICGVLRYDPSEPAGHDWENRWNGSKDGHYRRCAVCKAESDSNVHNYHYSEDWEDYECLDCHRLHSDLGFNCTGEPIAYETTCYHILSYCAECGSYMTWEGDFDHSFLDGACRYCGEPDPDYILPEEPETPQQPPDSESGEAP